MHGSRNSPAETAGLPLGHISGHLVSDRAGGKGTDLYFHITPIRFRFCDKCRKEHTVHGTRHSLSVIIPGLDDIHSTPLVGASESFQGLVLGKPSPQLK